MEVHNPPPPTTRWESWRPRIEMGAHLASIVATLVLIATLVAQCGFG